jgi:hypothetical protein
MRNFLLTTLLCLTTWPAHAKPNIIVILVDDLGYGDLSSYGAPDLKSPAIDSLMAAGIRFDSFYANCPVCSPTRAALLSGTYPDLVGVPGVIRTIPHNNWGWLAPHAVLLPKPLKATTPPSSENGISDLNRPTAPTSAASTISRDSFAT